ncbi:hypothetical protein [Streptomyces sp. CRN 30]|uniref:hypothetical protein n=1 Tax=Streptomyces sp. CRN 30 TaxID=3075613 RepID=UPI002A806360|nr:hypothetical protein [Streptomyces sp. CRN 30]
MSAGDEHGGGPYGGTGQTRTRLPDPHGDVYGGARRGRASSSRSLVTVVGVVVLLIAAIAFANRGGSDSADGSTAGADKATGSPTAASGEQPVRTKAAGIPTGFAHDEQGAQSAAANYAVALGSTGMFRKESRDSIVGTVYTAAAAAGLQAPLDKAYSADFLSRMGLDADGNPPDGSTFVSRVVPVGTTVREYRDSTAEVAVWYMSLIGMSGERTTDPVTTAWKTWTFDLRWSDGDWKVTADTQEDGPVPVPGDDRAATSEEIGKAVEEYGGFTYAR